MKENEKVKINGPLTGREYFSRFGQVGYNSKGKPLMKSAALFAERNGEKITWKEKPGFENGERVDPAMYDIWARGVRY